MQRFYVPGPLMVGEVALPEHVSRQLSTVLRMGVGDRVVLFDGGGLEWVAELTGAGKRLAARLLEQRDGPAPSRRRVTLCQAVLKGERMEWVLQKGTELGVAVFQPVLTERVVAQKQAVPERWRRILIEAAEQCGRTVLPEVREPVALESALALEGPHALCWEGERVTALPLASYLAETAPRRLTLHVGPEGGYSGGEARRACERGAVPVSLGPLILRAETAAIAATSLALLTP